MSLKPGDLVQLIALKRIQYFCEGCGVDVRKYIGETGEVLSDLRLAPNDSHSLCNGFSPVATHRVRFGDFEQEFRPEILRKIEPPGEVDEIEKLEELTL